MNPQKPEIIFVAEAYVGGVKTHLNMLITGLLERGYQLKLIYSSRDEAVDSLPEQLQSISKNISAGLPHLKLKKLAFLTRIWREAHTWPKEAIVHVHGFYAFIALILMKFGRLPNPLIVTFHGGVLHKHGLIRSLLRLFMPFVSQYVSKFICVSFYDRQLQLEINIPDQQLVVLENSIDLSRIDNTVADRPNPYCSNLINIAIVSTLYRTKGVVEFLQDLDETRVFDPTIYHITLIGTGPLKHKVQALLSGSNYLSELVSYLGYMTEPYNYIKWSDMLLFPSRSETFGLVLFEGLYLSARVVAHQQPIAEKYLSEDCLVDFNNLKEVKEVVDRALAQERIMRPEQFQHAYQNFFESYIHLYDSV